MGPMRGRAIWTSWLGRMMGLLWVNAALAASPDMMLQQEAAARVPLPEVPEALRARVRQVIERPTLFSHGPAEAFTGKPALYHWLLDHPDRGVLAWRRRGPTARMLSNAAAAGLPGKMDQGTEITGKPSSTTPR